MPSAAILDTESLPAAAWLDAAALPLPADDARRSWLTEPGSLTRRLQAERSGAFSLELIAQVAEPLGELAAAQLGCAAGDAGHRREVRLLAGGAPCIYACSYWPEVTGQDQAWLDGLGERPLGDALFTHPASERGAISCLHLAPGGPQLAALGAADAAGGVWGRRSVFRLAGRDPLLVHEFFLPALFADGSEAVA